jgi:hypothetical protein
MIVSSYDMPAKLLSPPALPLDTPKKGPTPPLPTKSFSLQPLVPVADVPVESDILHKGTKNPYPYPYPYPYPLPSPNLYPSSYP